MIKIAYSILHMCSLSVSLNYNKYAVQKQVLQTVTAEKEKEKYKRGDGEKYLKKF